MSNPMEFESIQNQPNTVRGFARIAGVSAVALTGIAGIAAFSGADGEASQATGAGGSVEDCIDGTGPDYGPEVVDADFVIVPGQPDAYTERVCIQYENEYVERVYEGTDNNGYSEFGRKITDIAVDFEFLPETPPTTEPETPPTTEPETPPTTEPETPPTTEPETPPTTEPETPPTTEEPAVTGPTVPVPETE